MITNLIIGILITIVSAFVGIIGIIRPAAELGSTTLYLLTQITTITTMGGNFIHFMLGDYQAIIVPFVIALITIKYVFYPLVKLIVMILPIGN